MQADWKIKDLIDLEYFLGETRSDASDTLPSDFDRRTYLSFTRAHPENTSRRSLIRHWLDRRRQLERDTTEKETLLPGTAYAETLAILRAAVAVSGGLAGAAIVWTLFSYQGRQPINVFTCLWVLVIPQILMLLLLFGVSVLKKFGLGGSLRRVPPLLAALCRRMILKISRVMKNRVSAETQYRIRSATGLLGQTRTVYGSVFYWPFFLTAQTFGLFFNIGILVAMLIRVAITDLAFGWQSTLQPDPETVYQVVHTIALPWSWLVSPPIAHPTMAQIAGSKMVLKEGIYHLATQNLIAWWPFLCLAVCFYGLVPRAALMLLGWFRKRRALAALEFRHTACDRLIQRMQTPRVETRSKPYETAPASPAPAAPALAESTADATAAAPRTAALVLVPEEIADRADTAALNEQLHRFLGMYAAETISVQSDGRADAPHVLKAMANHGAPDNDVRIVILQEAWQPPIKETLSWLKGLRGATGKTTGMVIALIGKPASGSIFTHPADTDRLIWEQAINGFGDPYMRVETLGG